MKYFEPGQFRSLRQTVVFRDDFNHFNKGHFTTEVSAWGGGVSYIYYILILYPILFPFMLWSTFGFGFTTYNKLIISILYKTVVEPGRIICERCLGASSLAKGFRSTPLPTNKRCRSETHDLGRFCMAKLYHLVNFPVLSVIIQLTVWYSMVQFHPVIDTYFQYTEDY